MISNSGNQAEMRSNRTSKKLLVGMVLLLPLQFQAAKAELVIDTENLRLNFSDWGDLVEARACLPDCRTSDARTQDYSAYRGLLSINRDSDFTYELERINGDHSVQLIFKNLVSGEARRWVIPHSGWLLNLTISRPQVLTLTSGESFALATTPGFGGWLETVRYTVFEQEKPRLYGLDEELGPRVYPAGWLGYRNRYWTAMLKTASPVTVKLHGGPGQAEAQLDLSPASPEPGHFLFYVGPVEPAALESAVPGLGQLMYPGLWFWLRWICQLLFKVLTTIQSVIPDWGTAVIVLSLLVQLLMRPLNRFAENVQQQVRSIEARLEPKISHVKSSYKGAIQAERMLELYREEKVHPLYSLKSLLGLVLVVPVFIGAFNMLAENIWLSGQSFLWISDLSRPDAVLALPLSVPFFGGSLNLLPFVMTGLSITASVIQGNSLATPALRVRHHRRVWGMAVLFFLLFYTFPAAMVLYWTVSNLVSLTNVASQFGAGPERVTG